MKDRCCRTCSAYVSLNGSQGECRAKPPLAVPQVGLNPVSQRPEMRMLSGWPPTTPDGWCRDDWKPAHDITH